MKKPESLTLFVVSDAADCEETRTAEKLMMVFSLFCFAVVYLLVYHVIFIMFVWAYWQTIFTKPMNPLKEVSVPDCDAV